MLLIVFRGSKMGGHGHEPPYKVPHYTTFKVQGIPDLEELEKALAKKGLRDPWIRYRVTFFMTLIHLLDSLA